MTRIAARAASSPSRGSDRRSKRRKYLVGLTAWSFQVAWIEARNEEDACEKADELWQEDDSGLTVTQGGVDDIYVIEEQGVQS